MSLIVIIRTWCQLFSRNLFYLYVFCYMATLISYDITTQRSKVVRLDELILSFCHKHLNEKDA